MYYVKYILSSTSTQFKMPYLYQFSKLINSIATMVNFTSYSSSNNNKIKILNFVKKWTFSSNLEMFYSAISL